MKWKFCFFNIILLVLLVQSMIYSQTPLDPPTLISPSSGSVLTTKAVTLQWNSVSSATDYEIQIATDNGFQNIVIDQMSGGSTTFTETLINGTSYYWHVASYDGDDDIFSDYSSWFSFYISAPPKITGYDKCDQPAGWGAIVAIYGDNFGASQGNGSVSFFCGDPTISQTVSATILPNGWSNNEIDCYIPMHASSGPVIITNNLGLKNTSANSITYDIPWGYLGGNWSSMPVKYAITNLDNYTGGSKSPSNLQNLTNLINAAANTWCSDKTIALFNFYNDQSSSYIVGFGTISPALTARTQFTIINGNIQAINTVVNGALNWDSQYDLQTTMTHEFGHWLALSDLYGTDDDLYQKVMYGNYSGQRRSLSPYDLDGIQTIYGVGILTGIGGGREPIPFPTPPQNVQATVNGQSIVLTWNENNSSNAVIVIYKNNIMLNTIGIYNTSYTDANGAASLPVTYIVRVSNSTGAANSIPITVTSGAINSSTNWSGVIDIIGNVTVKSGCTLTINPGTVINLNPSCNIIINGSLNVQAGSMFNLGSGVSITVNGIMNATGTSAQPITFTSTGSTTAGSWGSIQLVGSGASGSSLNYVNMQYGTEIDVTNTSNITIQNSTIQKCTNGIVGNTATGCSVLNNRIKNVTNHGINLNNCTFTCKYNTINKTSDFAYYHTGFGILYGSGSSGIIYQNDICGFNQGIGSTWGSSVCSTGPYDNIKNNRVSNCLFGLMVYASGHATFGTNPNSGGMWNSFYNNSYLNASVGVTNTNYPSSVYTYGDWWGRNPPNTALFQVGAGSSLYVGSPLSADPWSGTPLPSVIADNKSTDISSALEKEPEQIASNQEANTPSSGASIEPLLNGIELRSQNKYSDAKDFFLSYLSKNPDNQAAYIELYNCYSEETASDIINYFTSLPTQASKGHKLLLANLYLKQGDINMAKKVNNDVIKTNPNSSLSARGKLNNALIALYNENDFNSAVALFRDVLNRPDISNNLDLSLAGERIETYAVIHGLKKPEFNVQSGTNETIPTTVSVQNYPNPFNPTTMINYQLPNDAKVTLNIFDILGREVMTLVDGEVAAGNHMATFDGSKLTSGIYFTRLIVQPQNGKPIMLVKKMVLMK